MYFSDRERGPRPRTEEAILVQVWGGIVTVISRLITKGAFGIDFPYECPDGEGTAGNDETALSLLLSAEVPELNWPPNVAAVPSTMTVLDCLEFCHRHVARPEQVSYHSYYRHHHLLFDRETGQSDFREDINRIFARNGVAYELRDSGRIERLAPPILRETLAATSFDTGDGELDSMFESARTKYLSPDPRLRKESLEKLWDAWERVKTIEPTGDKKGSIARLLDKSAREPKFRQVLENEAIELTKFGNTFQIRHSEPTQTPLQTSVHIDYLFHRLFAMIRLLLACR
jgi:hypothetical protein